MKILRILLLSLFIFSRAFGAIFSSNPTADAFVTTGPSGDLADINYGSAGSIAISAPGLPQGELQSVLRFDLGAALTLFDNSFGPGQWSVQSMTLQLTAALPNNPIFNAPAAGTIGISWMQNDAWTEGTGSPGAPSATGITFNGLQSAIVGPGDQGLGTFSFNGSTSGAFTYALGLTPGLLADALAGDNLSLRLFAADGVVSGVFNSRNFGMVANRPLLTIVAVPEPGTVVLGGLGFAFFAGWRLVSRGRKR